MTQENNNNYELDKKARQNGRDTLDRLSFRDKVLELAEQMEAVSGHTAEPSAAARREQDDPMAVVADRTNRSFRTYEQAYPIAQTSVAPVVEYVAPPTETAPPVEQPVVAAAVPEHAQTILVEPTEAVDAKAREAEAQRIIDAIHAETMAEERARVAQNPLYNLQMQPQLGNREEYDRAA